MLVQIQDFIFNIDEVNCVAVNEQELTLSFYFKSGLNSNVEYANKDVFNKAINQIKEHCHNDVDYF